MHLVKGLDADRRTARDPCRVYDAVDSAEAAIRLCDDAAHLLKIRNVGLADHHLATGGLDVFDSVENSSNAVVLNGCPRACRAVGNGGSTDQNQPCSVSF